MSLLNDIITLEQNAKPSPSTINFPAPALVPIPGTALARSTGIVHTCAGRACLVGGGGGAMRAGHDRNGHPDNSHSTRGDTSPQRLRMRYISPLLTRPSSVSHKTTPSPAHPGHIHTDARTLPALPPAQPPRPSLFRVRRARRSRGVHKPPGVDLARACYLDLPRGED